MNEPTVKTDNELIAEFMGVKSETEYLVTHYSYDKHFHGWISESSYDDVKHLNTTGLEETRIKQNPYHTSWDWLMPVVDKIDSLRLIDGDLQMWDDKLDDVLGLKINSKIETAYKAVVEFIKWYNTQKQ